LRNNVPKVPSRGRRGSLSDPEEKGAKGSRKKTVAQEEAKLLRKRSAQRKKKELFTKKRGEL